MSRTRRLAVIAAALVLLAVPAAASSPVPSAWETLRAESTAQAEAFWVVAKRIDADRTDLLAQGDLETIMAEALATLDAAGMEPCWAEWWTVQRSAFVIAALGLVALVRLGPAPVAPATQSPEAADARAVVVATVPLVQPLFALAGSLAEDVECPA